LRSASSPQCFAAEGATLSFAQTTASPFFSAEGTFAGQSIADVAGALRAGTLTTADVPVQFITMDGTNLLVNTRSSLALMQAGIPTSQWALIDMTGDAATEALINQRLLSNGLSTLGTSTLRITGSGPGVSTLIPGP
jgi:filamentous hemagglutinin